MGFQKILCPIDFSPCAHDAMLVAVRLAVESDAELVLSHVWYLPESGQGADYPMPPGAIETMTEQAERGLGEAASEATRLGATRVVRRFTMGVPRDVIVELLRDDPAFDLVVMGTHGRTGFARILLGSVTEGIVRQAPCPVMAVRAGRNVAPFHHVLCPIDFSESSRAAVYLAAELATSSGAGITLLHVVELPLTRAGRLAPLGFVADSEKKSGQLLAEWAAALAARAAVPVTTQLRTGSPGVQTLALLEDDPSFDLVVMGRHARTGVRRLLLGSVADKVVRHAGCPVLVAHARA